MNGSGDDGDEYRKGELFNPTDDAVGDRQRGDSAHRPHYEAGVMFNHLSPPFSSFSSPERSLRILAGVQNRIRKREKQQGCRNGLVPTLGRFDNLL